MIYVAADQKATLQNARNLGSYNAHIMISVIYRLYVKQLEHFCSVENVKRIVYRTDTEWGFLTAVKAAN